MKNYFEEVKGRIDSFQIRFVQILREENECADQLAKDASVEYMLVLIKYYPSSKSLYL